MQRLRRIFMLRDLMRDIPSRAPALSVEQGAASGRTVDEQDGDPQRGPSCSGLSRGAK